MIHLYPDVILNQLTWSLGSLCSKLSTLVPCQLPGPLVHLSSGLPLIKAYLDKFQHKVKLSSALDTESQSFSKELIVLLNKYQRTQQDICNKLPSSTGIRQLTYNSAVAADYDEDGRWDRKGDQDLHAVVQDQVTKVVVAGDLQLWRLAM